MKLHLKLIPGILASMFLGIGCAGDKFGGDGAKFAGEGKKLTNDADANGEGGLEDGLDGDGNGPGGPGSDSAADADGAGGPNGGSGRNVEGGEEGILGGGDGAGGDIQLDDDTINSLQNCKYFDRELKGTQDVAHRIQGGPPIDIDVSKYTLSKAGQMTGDNYMFEFKAYASNGEVDHIMNDPSQWTPEQTVQREVKWPVTFRGTITNADADECQVTAQVSDVGERTQRGCFEESTRITMADGTKLRADLLQKGAVVYNPVTKKNVKVAEVVIGPEKDTGLFEVGYADKEVAVTSAHPFETQNGIKMARELTKADKLLGQDGKFHAITELRQRAVDPSAQVVNLRLATDSQKPAAHMVEADGVVSGDLYLQRRLQEQRSKERDMKRSLAKLSLQSL